MKIYYIISLVLLLSACSNAKLIQNNQEILFIGDSITKQGGYIKVLVEFIEKENTYSDLTLVNVGKNSETVSGLSEPPHNPPRPSLFDRLDVLIKNNKPDLVFFCYGINDGIYNPYSAANFQKYKDGVTQFLTIMEQLDIPVILLTPTPFAIKKELKETLIGNNDKNYSWENPYFNYDVEVMQKYRKYILSIQHPSVKSIIDIYQPLKANQESAYDNDPIHPNKKGHQLIGEAIINALF